MAQVVAEGAKVVWTVARGMAEVVAKRTVVVIAMVLGVTGGALATVGAFILWAVDMKMPHDMALKTMIHCRC